MVQPPPAHRPRRAGLLAVLAGFALLAGAYGVAVPIFEQPDESTHFFMAQHLAWTASLPVQPADADARGPWEQQGSQPPLYYALAAPLLRLAGGPLAADGLWYNDQNTMGMPSLVGNENRFIHDPAIEGWPWRGHVLGVHLARGLSTLLGLATLLAVWAIAGQVFPARPALALAATACVAFNPQFVAVHAAISNDPAIILLATAALALTLRVAAGHEDRGTLAALALAAGLAPLAKLSGLAVTGFVLLSLAALAWRRRDGRWWARTAGPVLLVALLGAGWWYARNLALYGDATGLNFMHPGGTKRHEGPASWLAGLPEELNGVWLSSWGLFGWFTLLLPAWLYALLSALTLAALAGLALAWRRRAAWLAWPVVGWLALWGGLMVLSLLRWMWFTKGGQGRLLFPAIALFGAALVAGWRALAPARVSDRALAAGVGGAMAALALFSLSGVIVPAYALPATIPEAAIPGDARRLDGAVFDGRLQLVAIQHPDRVAEGGLLPVTLYWKVLAPIARDGLVGLRVDQSAFDPGSRFGPWPARLEQAELLAGEPALAYPGAGTMPPRLMRPGAGLYVDRRLLAVPRRRWSSQPVRARLAIQLFDPVAATPWPLAGGEGRGELASAFTLAGPPASLPPVEDGGARPPPLARFENGIEVYAGWLPSDDPRLRRQETPAPARSLAPGAKAEGPQLLVWRATRPVAEDLAAFAHLVDRNGRMVAQADGLPATRGYLPTSSWAAGDVVVGAGPSLALGADLAPGAYRLLLGLYRPGDGGRVPAYRPDGARWPEDAVPAAEIEVQ